MFNQMQSTLQTHFNSQVIETGVVLEMDCFPYVKYIQDNEALIILLLLWGGGNKSRYVKC